MRRLVLASASPRRRELLSLLGLKFESVSPRVDEAAIASASPSPERMAESLALAKAEWAVAAGKRGIVIGADTVVVHRGRVLGKPESAGEGREILRSLRGEAHRVVTGLATVDTDSGARRWCYTDTTVRMRRYSDQEIEAYLASGCYADKAGAYGIQDRPFSPVESVEGCYLNVVGLPLCQLAGELEKLGLRAAPAAMAGLPEACRSCPSCALPGA